jgi:hypothetical protein
MLITHCGNELRLADGTVVVEVECVAASRMALRDVSLSPVRRYLKVARTCVRGACSASSASAISSASHSMSRFHSLPG